MVTSNFLKCLYGYLTHTKPRLKGSNGTVFEIGSAYSGLKYYLEFDSTSDYYPSLRKFVKSAKTATYPRFWGVAFGDGTTPPTIDDYQLAGTHFLNYSGTVNSVTTAVKDDCIEISANYTITNTGGTDFTISEVGLYGNHGNYDTSVLVERTLLDTPVLIPAGGFGQVTYTIRMMYPTA